MMRRIVLTAFFFVALLSVAGCSFHPSTADSLPIDNATVIHVPSETSPCSVLDSICCSYQLIPLDTTDSNCLLGTVDGLEVCQQGFVVWDTHQRKKVVLYSFDGSYLHSFGRAGRGPGEYIQPDDVCIVDSTLLVLDCFGHKMIQYSLDGTYLADIPFKMNLKKIQADDSSCCFYAVTGSNRDVLSDSEVILLDSLGSFKNVLLKNHFAMNYTAGPMLSRFENTVHYHKPLSNRIITFCNEPQVAFFMDFGANGLPEGYEMDCKGDYYNFVDQYDRSGLYTYFSGYFQLISHYALLGLVRQGAKALCIYDLDNGQAYVFDSSISSSSINPDNLNGLLPVALSHPLATSGNSVYCLLEPFIASLIDQGLSILRVDFE